MCDSKSTPAITVPGRHADQVCQVKGGRSTPSVLRPSLLRASALRPGLLQASALQPSVLVDGAALAALSIPAVSVPPVAVPAVDVPAAVLPFRYLPGEKEVRVATGKDRTAYLAPGDILFATDRATLRPAATKVLRAIAKRIDAGPDDAKVTVEGHTDSRAGAAHNLDLSRRRAQTVATWLQRNAGISPSRLTVTGRGETAPIASNATAAGRQRNRRVVITVEKG